MSKYRLDIHSLFTHIPVVRNRFGTTGPQPAVPRTESGELVGRNRWNCRIQNRPESHEPYSESGGGHSFKSKNTPAIHMNTRALIFAGMNAAARAALPARPTPETTP